MRSIPTILQATAWYLPHHLGGTEVYLEGLISALQKNGVKSSVITPRHPSAARVYEYNGTPVETYPVNATPGRREMRSGRPHDNFEAFIRLLHQHRGAIYHQHSWTRGLGSHHLAAAKAAGFKTVITVHVPGNICLRGTMLKFGQGPCGGPLREKTCAACWTMSRGLPMPISALVARMPTWLAELASRQPGPIGSGLGARVIAAQKLDDMRGMIENSDRVVAVCQWLYDALKANGVSAAKLVLNRQGISTRLVSEIGNGPFIRDGSKATLRLLMIGRWDPVKGFREAVQAICRLPPELPLTLDVYASPSGGDPLGAYEKEIKLLATADSRIRILPSLARSELASVMKTHDALVVPSLWLETGPLVVLEAQAAGLFVVGSRLGGIAELVSDGIDGMLVTPGDVAAWSDSFVKLLEWHTSKGLPRPRRAARTMDVVAMEMAELYRSLN